jgi:PAS domain-containing protein
MEQPSTLGLNELNASHYLRQLLQTIPVGVVTVDSRGVALAYNQTANDILSFRRPGNSDDPTTDAPTGILITDFFGEAERLARLIAESFGGEPRSEVFERRGPKGPQHVEITTRRVSIGTEEPVAMLVLQDVTTRRAADKELKRAPLA